MTLTIFSYYDRDELSSGLFGKNEMKKGEWGRERPR
jgi:hypothetical protein